MEERLEAHQILFTGQSNVRVMANQLGCTLQSLQESFSQYVDENKLSGDEWQQDEELCWPFA